MKTPDYPMHAGREFEAGPFSRNAGASAERPALDPTRLSRLRWRCRRGMLENDLVLDRFLAEHAEELTESDVAALDRLLDLSDADLWGLMSGQADPINVSLVPLVARLRAV